MHHLQHYKFLGEIARLGLQDPQQHRREEHTNFSLENLNYNKTREIRAADSHTITAIVAIQYSTVICNQRSKSGSFNERVCSGCGRGRQAVQVIHGWHLFEVRDHRVED